MQFPSRTEYETAIANLDKFARSSVLNGGRPRKMPIGELEIYSGGVTSVFPIDLPTKTIALRCWIDSNIDDAQLRYSKLQRYLHQHYLPFFVSFDYLAHGIFWGDTIWPVLVMDWVEGPRLNEYLDEHINDSAAIGMLADSFAKMVEDLHRHQISHGDLQHGNILVETGNPSPRIRLIDYDSLYAPPLAGLSRNLKGVAEYQHPKRHSQAETMDLLKVDYFSELVIYLSLRAYSDQPTLWEQTKEQQDRLLFTLNDFVAPENSPIFLKLKSLSRDVRRLAEGLIGFCKQSDLNKLQPLETMLAESVSGNFHIVDVDVNTYFRGSRSEDQRGEEPPTASNGRTTHIPTVDLDEYFQKSVSQSQRTKSQELSRQEKTILPSQQAKRRHTVVARSTSPWKRLMIGFLILGFLALLSFFIFASDPELPGGQRMSSLVNTVVAAGVTISQEILSTPTIRSLDVNETQEIIEERSQLVPTATSTLRTTQIAPPTTVSGPTRVQAIYESISIRQGPAISFPVVGYAFRDDILDVLGATEDASWYMVAISQGTFGWVSADVVVDVSDVETNSVATSAYDELLSDNSGNPKLQVSVIRANLRSGPGTNYDIVMTLPQDTLLPVIARSQDGTWFSVWTPDGTKAWIGSLVTEPVGSWELSDVPLTESIPTPARP